jgi:hypothetical protein
MSALQKAIRRGRVNLALSAAATLLRDSPDRLWRRLGGIAPEDVGVGSLEGMNVATAAMAGKRKRAEAGGDWAVAHAVIHTLSAAAKCRAGDDLLMLGQWLRDLRYRPGDLATPEVADLISVVVGTGTIEDRAVAMLSALANKRVKPRRMTEPVFDALSFSGWPEELVEVARLNFNRTGVELAPMVIMLAGEFPDEVQTQDEAFPPEVLINGVPGWAFDIYTREGRAAFTHFLVGSSRTADWLRRHVVPAQRLHVIGHCVFRVEGGLIDQRLRWPLADRLRKEVDVGGMGLEPGAATELLDIVRADIPAIDEAREYHLSRRH